MNVFYIGLNAALPFGYIHHIILSGPTQHLCRSSVFPDRQHFPIIPLKFYGYEAYQIQLYTLRKSIGTSYIMIIGRTLRPASRNVMEYPTYICGG